MAKRRMLLNAFSMNCVVHQSPGLWVRDEDKMTEYKNLDVWTDLAKLLEKGKFDALFLADVIGVYDIFNSNHHAAAKSATQLPVNDPMLLIPAMAQVTEHLGFGFTSSILQYNPFIFARLASTLDFITDGRIAWNIVTSYLESTGKSLGLGALPDHDVRYDMADDYCEAVYKLWEASWADDAVIKDKLKGVYSDPDKIKPVVHNGPYYQVDGVHLTEPSPQRTPIIFQAGASPRGRDFAAKHAECTFFLGPNAKIDGGYVKDVRKLTAERGRDPSEILCFAYMKIITGGTEEEAQRKYKDYLEDINYDGAMALMSGWSGLDFSELEPDMKIEYVETNAMRTMLHAFTKADPDREWTVRDVANYAGIGGAGPVLIGSDEQIADQLEDWTDEGLDGFNIAYGVTPGSFEDFIEGVVPILQKRGRVQKEYQEGTLREKLYGPGRNYAASPHPAGEIREAAWEK
ncbi:MAG: LLM class flavin-dependent oxidoreductase [Pseudomonadota bacterium]